MDFDLYLNEFQKVADQLDKALLTKKNIEVAVGIYGESVFLKLYNKTWANKSRDILTSDSRIFFSVWINGPAIKEQKLLYNIHALKLRQLKGYSITSRAFADNYRERFKNSEYNWPNVSVQFGPQTLMQGWVITGFEDLQDKISTLANQFLKIDHLIDDTLEIFKTSKV